MQQKRLYHLDFIRVTAIIAIILFHYNIWSERIVSPSVLLVKNYTFLGAIGVSLFLVLSGASIFHSTKNNFNAWQFYKKRFLALFPMFYLIYACFMFLALVFHQYDLTVEKNPFAFLLTIVGLDGLLSTVLPTYYLIGEWFLGCIVVLYLLFPAIRYGFYLQKETVLIISFAIFLLLQQYYTFSFPLQRLPLFRMAEFIFGMYYMAYSTQKILYDLRLAAFILSVFIILYFFDRAMLGSIEMNFYGVLTFILLANISQYCTGEPFRRIVAFLSRYSYPAFLVHHILLKQILIFSKHLITSATVNLFAFFLLIVIVFIVSYVFDGILRYLMQFFPKVLAQKTNQPVL